MYCCTKAIVIIKFFTYKRDSCSKMQKPSANKFYKADIYKWEINGDRKGEDAINEGKQATSNTFLELMNNSAYSQVQKCILLNNQ